MRLPVLDDRLSRAAALFPACAYGADIGADHGRLSCFLLSQDICERMCVADISPDSLEKARMLLVRHGLSDRADIRVGDGLDVLHGTVQAIAILGMGGRTLRSILIQGKDKLEGAALILSAHTDMFLVRQTLLEIHYRIETEQIAWAGRRFYVVMRALPGHEVYTERQMLLGPRLTESCPEHYPAYIQWRIAVASGKRGPEAERELIWLKEEEERVRNCENH